MTKPEMNIPILELINESQADILLTIEPHLEQYSLPSQKKCNIFYTHHIDNLDSRKTLSVVYMENEILLYSPGEYSPRIEIDNETIVPMIV